MAPYFLIFLAAACFALAAPPDAPKRDTGFAFFLFAILLALMIGFRWEVGGDWTWDTRRMIRLADADFIDYTKVADPGYAWLMWLGAQTGFNIWFVHLLAGGIFAYGLWRFCLDQPHPWLCMVIAIPYLVIVVAMGYDRQAVAIGFVMLAMVAIRHRSMAGFVGSMALATTMHLTALTFMPVFLLGSRVNKLWAVTIAGPFFMLGYHYSLQDSLQKKVQDSVSGYIDVGYSSSGAAVRIVMNALPAFLYFVFRSRFKFDDDERRFLNVLALIALAFVGLLYVSPSSTAVDRMALYIIPIQLLVLGRLPLVFAPKMAVYKMVAVGIVLYSATVMFVWLNFADDASAWVPYSLFDAERLVGLSY
jgi:hypothetical protein